MILPSISNQKGFSLISLLIAMMGIGLIATNYYLSIPTSANDPRSLSITQERMRVLSLATRKYLNTTGRVPSSFDDLLTKPANIPVCNVSTNTLSPMYRKSVGWCGPYLEKPPLAQDQTSFKTDGWGTTFVLAYNLIRSCGPDTTCSNGDDILEYF